MAGEPLIEELALDISPALDALQPLADALTNLATDFSTALADALGSVSDLTATPIEVTADASALDASIADALDAPRPPIDVEADTSNAVADIAAIEVPPLVLDVEADTSGAVADLTNLGDAATGATGGSGSGSGGAGGGGGLSGLEGALIGVKAASAGASGSVSGATGAISGLGSGLGPVIGAGAAFVGLLGETVRLGADAEAQQKRFNAIFGATAPIVSNINIGGLNLSLQELGKESGTTVANLEASASKIAGLGKSAGAAPAQIAETTKSLIAIGAVSAVTNPRLGDTATVTDALSRAMLRGGARLAAFGISLSAAQIQAEALKETGKSTAAELTAFDRLTAATNLRLGQLGDTLGTKFQTGAQNAAVQLRALKTELTETLTAIGRPLLEPTIEAFRTFLPIAESLGEVLGRFGQAIVPLVADLAPALIPLADALGFIADGIGFIADGIGLIPAPVIEGIAAAFVAFGVGLAGVDVALGVFGAALDLALGPVGLAVGALALLGVAVDKFGGHAHSVTIDTVGLTTALEHLGASTGTQGLVESTAALKGYVDAALKAKDTNPEVLKGFKELGIDSTDAAKALLLAPGAFNDYINSTFNAASGNKEWSKELQATDKFLSQQFTATQNLAHVQLNSLVATGQIAPAQRDQALAATAAAGAEDNFVQALARGEQISRANAKAKLAVAESTGELQRAFTALKPAIADSTTTEADAQQVADQLGISVEDAKSGIQSLKTSMDSFVSAGVSALPGAGAAIEAFASGIDSAQQKVASAAGGSADAVQKARVELLKALDPQQLIDAENKQTVLIVGFQQHIASLLKKGNLETASLLIAEGPLKGGAAAAAFDANSAQGQAFESGAKLGSKVVSGYGQFLESHKAELAGKLVTLADGTTVDLSTVIANAAPAVSAATGKLSEAAAGAFNPDIKGKAQAQIQQAADIIPTLVNLPNVTGLLGVDAGEAFGQGLANGMGARSSTVADAAAALASTADAAVKRRLGIRSPSTVGITLGQQFVAGITVGIHDAQPSAIQATTGLSKSIADQLQAELVADLAAAAPALTQAFSSLLSTITGALPTIGSTISAFSSNAASATTAYTQALTANHAAYKQFATDQATIPHLLDEQTNAHKRLRDAKVKLVNDTVALNSAQDKLNADTAAKASKATIAADRSAVSGARATVGADSADARAAESNLNSVERRLGAARAKVATDAQGITSTAATLHSAQDALAKASDPATLIKNLNAQNAANQRFIADIAKLKKEGFGSLAEQLAEAGPASAGKIADAFAGSPAQAKTADTAIKTANNFTKTFSDRITNLFGPGGAAAASIATVGTGVGTTLTGGVKTSLTKGLISGINGIPAAIAFGAHTGIASSPLVLGAPTSAAGQAGASSFGLDLTLVLQDGSKVKAKTTIPVPKKNGPTLKQRVTAEIHAS